MPSSTSQRARKAYADALAAKGPAYANAADSVRSGYSNLWIDAGLVALESVLSTVPDEEEDDA